MEELSFDFRRQRFVYQPESHTFEKLRFPDKVGAVRLAEYGGPCTWVMGTARPALYGMILGVACTVAFDGMYGDILWPGLYNGMRCGGSVLMPHTWGGLRECGRGQRACEGTVRRGAVRCGAVQC